ncbi:hypothetical protein LCGC14_1050090 [marine sediment metagenome]|uniref:Uncharacterized protein n=1 Tax=marine sediment metagenome TaxID=412755 RepID=A0A0F9QV47_9ZZZZ
MTTQSQVNIYVEQAMVFPIRDREQLVAMVLLHFSDLNVETARRLVSTPLKRLNPPWLANSRATI